MTTIRQAFEDSIAVKQACVDRILPAVESLGAAVVTCLEREGTVFWFGNGGSAADAQHAAAELVGRFVTERRPLSSQALTTDASALTAIANDYGYEQVFARQVRGRARRGDIVIGISTSGKAPSVLNGLQAARELGVATAGLTGRDGGGMPPLCDHIVIVPAEETARIQEVHITIIHCICQMVDEAFSH